jgi:hypothetical protein
VASGAAPRACSVDGHRVWVGTADGLFLVEDDVAVRLSARDTHHVTVDGAVVWVGTRSGLEQWAGGGVGSIGPLAAPDDAPQGFECPVVSPTYRCDGELRAG